MSDPWWVLVIIRGAEKRWPEEGAALIRHKAQDFTHTGWVMKEDREEAIETFMEWIPPKDQRNAVKVMSGRLIEVEEKDL